MEVKLKDDYEWQTEYPIIHAEQTKKIEDGGEANLPPSLYELGNDFKVEDGKLIVKDKKLIPNAKLLYETCLKLNPKSIFEVGFGYCNHLVSIKKLLPNTSINGCDISQAMYDAAKKRQGDLLSNFNLKIEDFLLLNTDERFDMVYSQAVVMHMSTERAKESIKKMCKISNKYVMIIDGAVQIPNLKPFVEQFGKVTYFDEWAKKYWPSPSYSIPPFIIEVKK